MVSCFIKLIEHLLYIIYATNAVIPYKIYSNKSLNNQFKFWLHIACKTWLCWRSWEGVEIFLKIGLRGIIGLFFSLAPRTQRHLRNIPQESSSAPGISYSWNIIKMLFSLLCQYWLSQTTFFLTLWTPRMTKAIFPCSREHEAWLVLTHRTVVEISSSSLGRNHLSNPLNRPTG